MKSCARPLGNDSKQVASAGLSKAGEDGPNSLSHGTDQVLNGMNPTPRPKDA